MGILRNIYKILCSNYVVRESV